MANEKRFWSKKNFGPKTIWSKKILIQKKIWPKTILTQKIFDPKNFWPKKIFTQKIFGPDNIRTLSRHCPDTIQTPSRHHPDTFGFAIILLSSGKLGLGLGWAWQFLPWFSLDRSHLPYQNNGTCSLAKIVHWYNFKLTQRIRYERYVAEMWAKLFRNGQ